jgi:hypothetical protein
VLPSTTEVLSLALLDATGAGLCLLTTDVGENREAVEDDGLTFRCGDADDFGVSFQIPDCKSSSAPGCRMGGARLRVRQQGSKISSGIELACFEVMGWELPAAASRRPSAGVTEQVPVLPKAAS